MANTSFGDLHFLHPNVVNLPFDICPPENSFSFPQLSHLHTHITFRLIVRCSVSCNTTYPSICFPLWSVILPEQYLHAGSFLRIRSLGTYDMLLLYSDMTLLINRCKFVRFISIPTYTSSLSHFNGNRGAEVSV